jgi:ubiquinone/menaquinone biosynthesis C-methylase UbiE
MNNQRLSNTKYIELTNKVISNTEKAGRYADDKNKEKYIFRDVIKKLELNYKNKNLLDIGCGVGPLVNLIIKFCEKNKIQLYLCDINHIIKEIKSKFQKRKYINYIESEFQKFKFYNIKFDRILIYSVIQYVNNPKKFLLKAFKILNRSGLILLGDIPNVNKKFRFLNSDFGYNYEIQRKKIPKKKLNLLTSNLKSFLNNTLQNTNINDKFILWIVNKFQKLGCNVYISEQPKKLPYSYTRIDLIIKKI